MKYARRHLWLIVSVAYVYMYGIAHAGLDEGAAALEAGKRARAARLMTQHLTRALHRDRSEIVADTAS